MSLKRDVTYPGRFSTADTDHPMGAFKNRTSPDSQDGSYLEAAWANDLSGFLERILTAAGVAPNGTADTATSSQVFDALMSLVLQKNNLLSEIASLGNSAVANARNNIGAASKAGDNGQKFWVASAPGDSNAAVPVSLLNQSLQSKLNKTDITSGDNGNGHYMIMPNAIFCRSIVNAPANSNFTWVFPTSFPSAPLVLQSGFNLGSGASIWLTGVSENSANFYNNGAQNNVDVFAYW